MKSILLGFLFFCLPFSSYAQIKSLDGFKHTISFLHGSFKLDAWNANCKSCHDCRKAFTEDSLTRADTTSYKWYPGSRTAAACSALQKLQFLLSLDSLLQVQVGVMEHKYKSNNDSMYREFVNLNKSWYLRLDRTVQYYNSFNEMAYSGPLIEQINIATIMVKSRLDELTAIEKLLRYE